jgi:hypothetical protein
MKRRKSIFDITRVGDSELAVSNIIAFYLDQDEEHGLKDLFFQSLMELYFEKASEEESAKWTDVLGDGVGYSVSREWYIGGAERKFLDIVITGAVPKDKEKPEGDEVEPTVEYPWAILIENKIHAGPYNKLEEYEKAVDSPLKALIYLALHDPGKLRAGWYFIPHAELIARVREKLPRYFDAADDKHLLLLKDHFYNLERHSMKTDEAVLMNQLKALHQKREEIKKLNDVRDDIAQHWATVLDAYMKRKGFAVGQKEGYTDHRAYVPDLQHYGLPAELEKCVKIYVPMWELLDNAVFKASFELNGTANTEKGEDIRISVASGDLPSGLKKGGNGKLKGNFYHILLVEKEVPAASTLTEAIESILDSTLFRNDSSYIKATIQQVKEKRGIQA